MKAAHQLFEYLTAFAVVVLFSAVILFFPDMEQGKSAPEGTGISIIKESDTQAQPAAAVTPQDKADGQAQS